MLYLDNRRGVNAFTLNDLKKFNDNISRKDTYSKIKINLNDEMDKYSTVKDDSKLYKSTFDNALFKRTFHRENKTIENKIPLIHMSIIDNTFDLKNQFS